MKLTREQIAQIQEKKLYRSFVFDRSSVDEEARTVQVAFSSEDPYKRWFGIEVLGHQKEEVDMIFLNSGSAPALAQHNHSQQIGVIEKAWIDNDGVGRCVIRFSKGVQASEYFQDVLDGIRKNISVGYQIVAMKLVEENEDIYTYRITKWEPFEVSFVSVPADKTVGVGRSAEEQIMNTEKGKNMPDKTNVEAPGVDVKKIEADTRKAELDRIREIDALGDEFNLKAEAANFKLDGKSIDQFRAFALDHLKKNGITPVEDIDPNIGLGKKEVKKYSFLRAINAMANPGNQRAQENAKFELECSEAVQTQLKSSAKGFMVPMDVMTEQRAGQVVATPGAGGALVDTVLMSGSFIDLLRNAMLMVKMGVTTLDGLVGDIAVPKLVSGHSAYWVDENADPDESAAVFGQITMTPKTVGSRTELSRKFLLQSSIGAENFARMELAMALALEIDRAILNGSGTSPEPRGILNASGIGAVECGDNGGAASWAKVVALWAAVATGNAAVGNTGFITNSKAVGQFLTTEKAEGTAQFLVKDFPDKEGFTSLAGARCGVTNQMPSDFTKGTGTGLSGLVFGNFADIVVGHWGSLDLTIDPYSKAESGAVRVIALQDIDVAIKRPQSFAAIKDIATE